MSTQRAEGPPIDLVKVSCYNIPTETHESDGTMAWNKTTMVLVELHAADTAGIGWSYADVSAGKLIESLLSEVVLGCNAFDIPRANAAMGYRVRNAGKPGVASMAISAVDNAMWDLKARLLDLSLLDLLGAARESAPVYGSGGFTCYNIEKLQYQLAGWAAEGIKMVKMKVGTDAASDLIRVRTAREAIGPDVQLFVDANGAYSRKQALKFAEQFADYDVRWFEEPVGSDDLDGLRLLRDRAPAGMEIAAGEYGHDSRYFRRMLEAGAVDVLQADATRCAGITGFLEAATLCRAFNVPFSFHCAPAIHAAAACAVAEFRVGEYFFDHVRIERMLFDGLPALVDGALKPDRSRPGFGCEFKRADAAQFAV